MQPGAVVLLSGPLDPPDWWSARDVRMGGRDVVAPVPAEDGHPPVAAWIASTARLLHALRPSGPLVLAGHGTAGPLLPALARTQRAAGRRVGGYVFVDAALPRPGAPSHLDLLRAAAAECATAAHDTLHESDAGWPPEAARPRGHDFWTEPLPTAPDWPDAPCAFVRTTATVPGIGPTDFWARSARARGWPVHETDDLARTLRAAIEGLPG